MESGFDLMNIIRKQAMLDHEMTTNEIQMWMGIYHCATERWTEYRNSPDPADQARAEREYETMTMAIQRGTRWSLMGA